MAIYNSTFVCFCQLNKRKRQHTSFSYSLANIDILSINHLSFSLTILIVAKVFLLLLVHFSYIIASITLLFALIIYILLITFPLNSYCNYYQDSKINTLFDILTKASVKDLLNENEINIILNSYDIENYSNNAELTQYRHEVIFNIIHSDNIVLFFKRLKKHKSKIPRLIEELKHPINDSFDVSYYSQIIREEKRINRKIKATFLEGLNVNFINETED